MVCGIFLRFLYGDRGSARGDCHGVSILEGGLAADKSDQFVVQKAFHTTTELLHNSILAVDDLTEVKPICKVSQPESLTLTQTVQNLSIPAEGLGRDAALVQTCTSHVT